MFALAEPITSVERGVGSAGITVVAASREHRRRRMSRRGGRELPGLECVRRRRAHRHHGSELRVPRCATACWVTCDSNGVSTREFALGLVAHAAWAFMVDDVEARRHALADALT